MASDRDKRALHRNADALRQQSTATTSAVFYQDSSLEYVWLLGSVPPFAADRILGRTDSAVLPPASAERLSQAKRGVLETRKSVTIEFVVTDGSQERNLEALVSPWLGANGELLGVTGCYRDVTAPGTLHEALHDQFVRMSIIFDSMKVIVYVADFETHELLFLNRYGRDLFGDEAVGKRCYTALQNGQQSPCDFCTNHLLVRDGRPAPAHIWEFQNTTNHRWYMCIDQAIPWNQGRLARMEVAIDITDRKAAELFRSQYLGVVSHDMKNPVNSIVLSSHRLKRRMVREGQHDDATIVDGILASANRIDVMIRDLADSARLEAGEINLHVVPTNITALINELDPGLGETVERCSRVQFAPAAEDLRVLCDPPRIERVLQNLIGNALKFSPPETTVQVTSELREGMVQVVVADAGPGIEEAERDRIFQRFYRSESAAGVEGLGLGLYITRLIVEAHGGVVGVEQASGQGARFYFQLPAPSPD